MWIRPSGRAATTDPARISRIAAPAMAHLRLARPEVGGEVRPMAGPPGVADAARGASARGLASARCSRQISKPAPAAAMAFAGKGSVWFAPGIEAAI
jgi:hypothetical protein